MGEVIRRTAAVEAILSDILQSLAGARLQGGAWQSEAERVLLPAAERARAADQAVTAAEDALSSARSTREVADERLNLCIGRIRDELWNRLGRPARHPELALLFPEGVRGYTGAPLADKPAALEVLCELLGCDLLSEVPLEETLPMATELRARTQALVVALSAYEAARVTLHKKTKLRQALVHAAHLQLAHLKRTYKTRGFTEPAIHRIIPDRPRPSKETPPEEVQGAVPVGEGPPPEEAPLGEALVPPSEGAGEGRVDGVEGELRDVRGEASREARLPEGAGRDG